MRQSNESQPSNIKTKSSNFFMLGKDLEQVHFGNSGPMLSSTYLCTRPSSIPKMAPSRSLH